MELTLRVSHTLCECVSEGVKVWKKDDNVSEGNVFGHFALMAFFWSHLSLGFLNKENGNDESDRNGTAIAIGTEWNGMKRRGRRRSKLRQITRQTEPNSTLLPSLHLISTSRHSPTEWHKNVTTWNLWRTLFCFESIFHDFQNLLFFSKIVKSRVSEIPGSVFFLPLGKEPPGHGFRSMSH